MQPFDFLVGYCNIGNLESRFGLGRYSCDGKSIVERGFIDLDAIFRQHGLFPGVTGICRFRGALYIGLQGRPNHLLVLRHGREPEVVKLTLTTHIHSMVGMEDGRLLIVSTGTDSVIAYDPETKREELFKSLAEGAMDSMHVNGITMFRGRPIICMIGHKKKSYGLRIGEVRDLLSDEVIASGLRSPHSVYAFGDSVYLLESVTGLMLRWSGGKFSGLPHAAFVGYTRGLHIDENVILVGRSSFRKASASFDLNRTHPLGFDEGYPEAARSCIYMIGPNGATVTHEVTDMAPEIYDILALQPEDHALLDSLPIVPASVVRLRKALRMSDTSAVDAAVQMLEPAERLAGELLRAEFKGDNAAALAAAQAGVTANPDSVHFHHKLSKLHKQSGATADAYKHARIAADLQPEVVMLQIELAALADGQGNKAEAIAAYRRAIALAPGGTALILRLAELLADAGETEEVVKYTQQALSLDSSSAVRTACIDILRRAGLVDEVRAMLPTALPRSPKRRAAAILLLSQIDAADGRMESALDSAKRALALDPDNGRYHLHYAELLFGEGKNDEAKAVLEEMMRTQTNTRMIKAARHLLKNRAQAPVRETEPA